MAFEECLESSELFVHFSVIRFEKVEAQLDLRLNASHGTFRAALDPFDLLRSGAQLTNRFSRPASMNRPATRTGGFGSGVYIQ